MTPHTLDTQRAFDSVAADYDGPLGNNELIQRMRHQVWTWMLTQFPRGSRLLELGCGTGMDAAYLAGQGYHILATDWPPNMVANWYGQGPTKVEISSATAYSQPLQNFE